MSRLSEGGLVSRLLTGMVRLRLWYLLAHHNSRLVLVMAAMVNSIIAIGILGLAAWWTHWALIFPSLGPSAFLFFSSPSHPAAWPRSAVLGHVLGVAAGLASLAVFGLWDAGPVYVTGMDGWRVAAAATSLAMVSGLMVALDCPHPPAASTTLIVSLGMVTSAGQVAALVAAVVALTAQAYLLNRMAGISYPLWRHRRRALDRFGPSDDLASGILTDQQAQPAADPDADLEGAYGRVASKLLSKRGWNLADDD